MKKNIKPIALASAIAVMLCMTSCNIAGFSEIESNIAGSSDSKSEITFETDSDCGETLAQTAVGILNAEINEDGELILTYTDGREQNLGVVVGKDGEKGEDGKDGLDGADGKDGKDGQDGADGNDGNNGEGAVGVGIDSALINDRGELILKYTDGNEQNLGVVVGKNGQNGVAISVTGAVINASGQLVLSYSNGTEQNLGVVVGKDGEKGEKGDTGEKGEPGSYVENTQNIEITVNRAENDVTEAVAKGISSAVTIICEVDNGSDTPEYSAGAGVIYTLDKQSGDAFIITNHHVVYNTKNKNTSKICEKIYVYLYGGESAEGEMTATYVGGSMSYDIAVLRIEDSEILRNSSATEAVMADSDKVSIGESAIAIGNPEGMGFSVTSGIVSVDSETISMLASDGVTEVDRRVMRIDTSVNHGNSGGGLFNVCGEVIGIVSAKIVLDDVENIGYAIPSNLARNVADNIIDHCWKKDCKTMQRAMFGVSVIATDTRAVYDSENGRVLLSETLTVYSVVEGGASDGKVFAGDVIRAVTCGEKTIYPTRVHQLIDFLLTTRLGDNVTFTLFDGMSEREVTITVIAEMISVQ